MGASTNAVATDPEEAPPPSVRPDFQLAAVASIAGLCDSRGNVPLNLCVLVRTTSDLPPDLEPRAERVLLQVDGARTLQDIAAATDLSLTDVIRTYIDLLGQGLLDAPEPLSEPSPLVEAASASAVR